MKKSQFIFALFLGFLLFSSANAASQPQVILDELLTGPIPALNAKDLHIPSDLAPGFHQLTVQVYNDAGVISSETALFCKDNAGVLHFDNKCPDLLVKPKPKPIPFNPLHKPEETINFYAVIISALSLLLGIGGKSSDNADLSGVDAAELGVNKKKFGWGDRRKYTNLKFFNALDDAPASMAKQAEKLSSLLARIIIDARYLRVIFANISWLTVPAVLTLTYMGLHHVKNEALPFSFALSLSIILIGVFDAFAGLLGAFLYIDFLFANGNLISKHQILFTLGYSLLFFAPALLASKFRPLHRTLNQGEDWWIRLTDYVLASLFTGWATVGMVKALTSQFGFDLVFTKYAGQIGTYVGLAILVRMLLEEFAWHLYPNRIRNLHFEPTPVSKFKKVRSLVLKISLFIYLAFPYIGWNKYLIAGIFVTFFPSVMSFANNSIPKTKYLNYFVPKGALKFTILGIVGIYLGIFLSHRNYPTHNLLLLAFIVIPVPGAVISILDLFNDSKVFRLRENRSKFNRFLYKYLFRIISISVLIVVAVLLSGHNPIVEIRSAWSHPANTWHSLTYKWWPTVSRDWQISIHWINVNYFKAWHWVNHLFQSNAYNK